MTWEVGVEAVGHSCRGVFGQISGSGVSDDARRFHAGAAQTLRSCTNTGATTGGLSCDEDWGEKKGSGVWCCSWVTTVEDLQVDGGRRPRLEGADVTL